MTVVVLALLLALAASSCVSGSDGTDSDDTDTDDAAAETPASSLTVVGGVSELACDGADRPVAEIRGAEPGEALVLSSPQPIQLSPEQLDAAADSNGTYAVTWRCDPSEAGQPWELRIAGEQSGRRATLSFTGTASGTDGVEALEIELHDGSFVCDGRSKTVGELFNAAPDEAVTFSAEGADDLVDGTADSNGRLTLTWDCSPDEATTWQVTARGYESDRVGEFTIVGVAPPPEDLLTPTVRIEEDPFLCDGGSRVFATISGFLPQEVVEFESQQSDDLSAGRADDNGDLPLRWTCGRDDAGTVWELTATGTRSGRTTSVTLTGAAPPPAPDLTVTRAEEPFRCDGETRFAATINGFTPREFVDFASPQVENLRQGQADETGTLRVRWTCSDGDIDRVWDITATGATSERSITFRITGASPEG